MRNKKKWGALVLAVIMVAALTLTGCRKERERIQVGETEPTTIVSTESESESESETSTEKTSETNTENSSESETQSTDANNNDTQTGSSTNSGTSTADNNTSSSTGNTSTGNSTGGSTGSGTGTSTGTSSGSSNGGSTGGDANTGSNDDGNGDSDNGDDTTVTTEAPRYFYAADGSRVDVSQLPDGSWQDANGVTYTFYENGVQDSNGNQYYYDPPSNGNTSVDVGTQADFYDSQGNHIVCVMDENGNWVDNEGNIYIFGEDGVTDSNGNFHPY